MYAGIPPLYKITEGKDNYIYLKNDDALEQYRAANKGKKYQVGRMKGLGEMDVDETEKTLANPNERIIKQITVADVKAADRIFDVLMGTATIPRKEFMKKHGEEATYAN